MKSCERSARDVSWRAGCSTTGDLTQGPKFWVGDYRTTTRCLGGMVYDYDLIVLQILKYSLKIEFSSTDVSFMLNIINHDFDLRIPFLLQTSAMIYQPVMLEYSKCCAGKY